MRLNRFFVNENLNARDITIRDTDFINQINSFLDKKLKVSLNQRIKNFFQLEEQNKVAILGDMFELGIGSSDEHQKLIEFCMNHENINFHFIKNIYRSE